ncbi:unnamed protein product [Prorocentrum cordatum]|uniref:Uncharacterized protein n=1 Tax=Prorocentrum cordatum TaxID=2364126 RepID=A0ABN9UX65_9DINO|nr:unnamed protein product [Polarella glacialis]
MGLGRARGAAARGAGAGPGAFGGTGGARRQERGGGADGRSSVQGVPRDLETVKAEGSARRRGPPEQCRHGGIPSVSGNWCGAESSQQKSVINLCRVSRLLLLMLLNDDVGAAGAWVAERAASPARGGEVHRVTFNAKGAMIVPGTPEQAKLLVNQQVEFWGMVGN